MYSLSLIPRFPQIVKQFSIVRYKTTGGKEMASTGLMEGYTPFSEETGLIVGRTLINPSKWKVPVLVSNRSHESITVEPFHEVGLITPVSTMQQVSSTRGYNPDYLFPLLAGPSPRTG